MKIVDYNNIEKNTKPGYTVFKAGKKWLSPKEFLIAACIATKELTKEEKKELKKLKEGANE